jgi:hypothetical protein
LSTCRRTSTYSAIPPITPTTTQISKPFHDTNQCDNPHKQCSNVTTPTNKTELHPDNQHPTITFCIIHLTQNKHQSPKLITMAPRDSKNKALLKMCKSPRLSAKPKDARLELLASLDKSAQIEALTNKRNSLFAAYERARKKLKRVEKDNTNLKEENEDLQATTEIVNGAIKAISEHMVPTVARAPTPPTDDSSTEMATSRE